MTAKRAVGRPRQFDDESERRLIFDAAYAAMRRHGTELTIADILSVAGVSTRSFYRHFESKDALLCAMYLRDAEWAAARLSKRLADATSPTEAVAWWIDEIFSFMRVARRAERVSVLGSIVGGRAEGAEVAAATARAMLIDSLQSAIVTGVEDGSFRCATPHIAAELIAAAVRHAAGLAMPYRTDLPHDQEATTVFCLQALGVSSSSFAP